jgi:hypothetical protein
MLQFSEEERDYYNAVEQVFALEAMYLAVHQSADSGFGVRGGGGWRQHGL